MRKNLVFIIGITGQDGAYLSHYLKKKNFTVIGFTRSKNSKNLKNLKKLEILNKVKIIKYSEKKEDMWAAYPLYDIFINKC